MNRPKILMKLLCLPGQDGRWEASYAEGIGQRGRREEQGKGRQGKRGRVRAFGNRKVACLV